MYPHGTRMNERRGFYVGSPVGVNKIATKLQQLPVYRGLTPVFGAVSAGAEDVMRGRRLTQSRQGAKNFDSRMDLNS